MTVTYALPQPSFRVDERVVEEVLREGPAYVRGPRSTRWHRVRSSSLRLAPWHGDEIRQVWDFWCGPGTHDGKGTPWVTDEPPADQPLCGTCEGRWRGAQEGHSWLFEPRPDQRPKVCPGSRRREFASADSSPGAGRCLVCRDYVKMRAFGGPYAGDWGPQRHAPGEGLPGPCEVHGYLHVRADDTRVWCECGTTLANVGTGE